jgi:hypothetical protein
MPPTQQPEDRQRARWLVRERALQHQHRAVVGQPPHLGDQPHRRGMQVQGGGRWRRPKDGGLHAQRDGPVDRSAEAAVGFGQRPSCRSAGRRSARCGSCRPPSRRCLQFALDLVEVALRVVAVALELVPGPGPSMRIDLPARAPSAIGIGLVQLRGDPACAARGPSVARGPSGVLRAVVLDGRRHHHGRARLRRRPSPTRRGTPSIASRIWLARLGLHERRLRCPRFRAARRSRPPAPPGR